MLSRVFGYDDLDRLTHAEGPWGTIDYTYDDVGNRLTKTADSVPESYTYVSGTNKLDTVGGTTAYTYDDNGNITGIGNRNLIYNQNNRLVRVEENSTILGEYTYNGLGQRVMKEVDSNTTVFHYDFDGNIIAESDVSGGFSKEYLYRSSNRLALVDYSVETNGEIYFFGNDKIGTPIILTDSTNTVVWEAVYKPFGETEVNPNSTVENNFRFKGQYYDSETGFHYNYHRYYDPYTGKYLRADPIGLEGGINLYTYVGNNPINYIDSLGLYRCIYFVKQHTMFCLSNDGKNENWVSKNWVSGNNQDPKCPDCQNNCENDSVEYHGPIVRGEYTIGEDYYPTSSGRPWFKLTPSAVTEIAILLRGRDPDTFRLHGCPDPATCSEGCVSATTNAALDKFKSLMDLEKGNNTLVVR